MTVLNLENLSADEQQRLHNAQQEASTLEAQLQSEQETITELKGLLEETKTKGRAFKCSLRSDHEAQIPAGEVRGKPPGIRGP